MSRVPPQVIPRMARALFARAGSFVMPIPIVRQFLRRGVARALPPLRAVRSPGTDPLRPDWVGRSGSGFSKPVFGDGSLPCPPSRGEPPACGHRLRPARRRLAASELHRVRPSEKETTTHFLELFAGAGGLTAAVRRLNLPVFESQDLAKSDESGFNRHFDLGAGEHFKELRGLCRRGSVRWLHGASPCKTFSRARRTDAYARSRILRSDEAPTGFAPQPRIVKEANLLASRMARLARFVYKVGGRFSIENPEASLMWKFSPLVSLAGLPGVSLFTGDQCALGGFHTKPIGWLANAPWLNVVCKRCPPEHPKHEHFSELR